MSSSILPSARLPFHLTGALLLPVVCSLFSPPEHRLEASCGPCLGYPMPSLLPFTSSWFSQSTPLRYFLCLPPPLLLFLPCLLPQASPGTSLEPTISQLWEHCLSQPWGPFQDEISIYSTRSLGQPAPLTAPSGHSCLVRGQSQGSWESVRSKRGLCPRRNRVVRM